MPFWKTAKVPVTVDNILTLTLPKSFRYDKYVRRNMELTTYQFSQFQKTDWGGYSQWPVVLHVTIFNPDLDPSEHERLRRGAFNDLAERLTIKDRDKVPWTENNTALRFAPIDYHRNLTDEPAWVVVADAPGFGIEFYAWQKRYSAKEAKAFAQETLASIQLKNLKQHWAEIADEPRRAAEAREAKRTRVKELLAAAGWPGVDPAGSVIEHEGFIYGLSADRKFFGIGLKLGAVKFRETMPNGEPRIDIVLSREEKTRMAIVWYYTPRKEWHSEANESSYYPPKELTDYVGSESTDNFTVYFYAFNVINFEFTGITDFQVTTFVERAKKLRELFAAGKVARPAP